MAPPDALLACTAASFTEDEADVPEVSAVEEGTFDAPRALSATLAGISAGVGSPPPADTPPGCAAAPSIEDEPADEPDALPIAATAPAGAELVASADAPPAGAEPADAPSCCDPALLIEDEPADAPEGTAGASVGAELPRFAGTPLDCAAASLIEDEPAEEADALPVAATAPAGAEPADAPPCCDPALLIEPEPVDAAEALGFDAEALATGAELAGIAGDPLACVAAPEASEPSASVADGAVLAPEAGAMVLSPAMSPPSSAAPGLAWVGALGPSDMPAAPSIPGTEIAARTPDVRNAADAAIRPPPPRPCAADASPGEPPLAAGLGGDSDDPSLGSPRAASAADAGIDAEPLPSPGSLPVVCGSSPLSDAPASEAGDCCPPAPPAGCGAAVGLDPPTADAGPPAEAGVEVPPVR